MKKNVRDWLIDDIIDSVKKTKVYDNCMISLQSIENKKFTDIFYLLTAEQTASVVDDLCAKGYSVSLGKLSSDTIQDCLTHIIFYSSISFDSDNIPENYVSQNITDSGVDTLSSPSPTQTGADNSNNTIKVDEQFYCDEFTLNKDIELLKQKYPKSIIIGIYEPTTEIDLDLNQDYPEFAFDANESAITEIYKEVFNDADLEDILKNEIEGLCEEYAERIESELINSQEEYDESDFVCGPNSYRVGVHDNFKCFLDLSTDINEELTNLSVYSWSSTVTPEHDTEFRGKVYVIESDSLEQTGHLIIASNIKTEEQRQTLLGIIEGNS